MEKKERRELIEKRSLNGKVFENEDHTFTTTLYNCPIHYQNNGVWEEIDNTLYLTEKQEKGNTEREWKNTKGSIKIKFSDKAKEKKTVSVTKGKVCLEWGMLGTKNSKGILEQKREEDQDCICLKKASSGIHYSEVLDNIDLQYLLTGEEIKENLIIKNRCQQNEFSFLYRVKHAVPRKKSEKIIFYDEQDMEVFQLEAPYMTDALGAMSKEIVLSLEKTEKENEWKVTIEADKKWLFSDKRKYPIVIDPSVTTPVTYSKIAGNIISSANGDLLDITNSNMVLSGRENIRRALFRFELPKMEPGDMIIDAEMQLVSRNKDFYQRRFHLHRILQNWEPDNTCWYNKPIYEEQIVDTCEYLADEIKLIGFNITDLVKDWYENGKNYGVMMKMEDETNAQQTLLVGPGSHEGISDLRPHILITYVNYSGLEGYWTYHTQNIGRAGKAYINDYNGNLIYIHKTFKMGGKRMPIQLEHIYNNTEYKNDIGYGLGMRLNYHQEIKKVTIGSRDYYQYIDGNGTRHYFFEKKEESGNVWKEETGSGITLTFGNTDQKAYILKNKNDKQLIFDKDGLLVCVKDRNKNEIKIVYTDRKITKIIDGVGRAVVLKYTNGILSSVTDPSKREKTFKYDTKKQLTTIVDIDGEIINLSYSNVITGLLKEIKNIDDYMVRYAYTGGNPRRIRRACEYAGTERGNALNMVYGYNKTTFTDDRGREETYLFNNQGNTISIKNDQGYSMTWKFSSNSNQVNRLSNQSRLQLVTAQLLNDPIVQKNDVWKGTANVSTIKTEILKTKEAKIGDRCMKITSTDKTGTGRFYQDIEIPKGREFTFSAYLKMKVTELGEYGGCYLSLYYKNKEGILKSVTCKRIETSGNTWRLVSLPFTMPTDASDNTVTVNIVLRNMEGELYADDLQVEWGLHVNRHNLVTNGDLTYNSLNQFQKKESDDCDKIVVCGDKTELPITGLAKVIPGVATVYKGPGDTYSKETDVWAGNPVVILGWTRDKQGNKWYRIRTQYDMTGFLKEKDISIFAAGGNGLKYGTVVRENVLVYQNADVSLPVNVNVFKDTQAVIHSCQTDSSGVIWYQVGFPSNINWCTGYIKGENIAENCTNGITGKAKADSPVYYTPTLDSTVVRNLSVGQEIVIRGSYRDHTGELWYMVPSFFSGKAGTYGYIKANELNVVEIPISECQDSEIVEGGNGNLNGRVYKIVGDPRKTKKLTQILELPGKKGDCYMINAWGKGRSIPLTEEGRTFGVEVKFITLDGTEEVHISNFGADTREWQYLCDAAVAKEDYNKIEISYIYGKNANVAYFDGLSLYKEEFGISFKYDENGNIISVIDAEKKEMTLKYDENHNITEMETPSGKKFSYEYDENHNVTSAVSAENQKHILKYDQYGNVVEQRKVNKENAKEYMKAKTTYTTDGNYPVSIIDAFGNTTKNEWLTTYDVLNSKTDAKGATVYFRYNKNKQLTAISTNVTSDGEILKPRITYEYTKDRLTQIGHNGFFYTTEYDGFGRKKSVKVADTILIKKEYEDRNGRHLCSTYGNGSTVRYVYDNMNRIKEIYVKEKSDKLEKRLCTYTYNKEGQIAKTENELTGKIYECTYDFLGRLGKMTDEKGNSYEYTYNEENKIQKIYRTVGSSYVAVVYQYDKDGREVISGVRGRKRKITYDSLGRPSRMEWNTTKPFVTEFTYVDGFKDEEEIITTTARIRTMKNGDNVISYEYDVNGNITKIQDQFGISTYEYDEMNQLIRENNHLTNKTVTYCYDVGGNLKYKKEYNLTTAEFLDMPTKTITCQYDTQWKDKIISFNETNFTYDAIGNPLSYGTITYEWCRGRKLSRVNNGKNIFYEYNVAGNRCKKIVDGVKTEYELAGKSITSETINGQTIWYNYDSSGQLISMIYDHKDYYYVRNAQGDIISLLDTAGNSVVSYQYDSWGKIIKITGTLATTLGRANPFRYRGYYYDEETQMYYLKSRYYMPETGRFLNADCYVSTGQGFSGNNMFQYCENNPVNRLDANGKFFEQIGKVFAEIWRVLSGGHNKGKYNLPDLGDDPNLWYENQESYNCYGLAIGKRINDTDQYSLTFRDYAYGMSAEEIFEFIKLDVGAENVRIVDFDYKLKDGERLVVLKVSENGYHFAAKIKANWDDGEEYKWCSKGGFDRNKLYIGVPEELIKKDTWSEWMLDDNAENLVQAHEYTDFSDESYIYDEGTLVFVLNESWDD